MGAGEEALLRTGKWNPLLGARCSGEGRGGVEAAAGSRQTSCPKAASPAEGGAEAPNSKATAPSPPSSPGTCRCFSSVQEARRRLVTAARARSSRLGREDGATAQGVLPARAAQRPWRSWRRRGWATAQVSLRLYVERNCRLRRRADTPAAGPEPASRPGTHRLRGGWVSRREASGWTDEDLPPKEAVTTDRAPLHTAGAGVEGDAPSLCRGGADRSQVQLRGAHGVPG